MEGPPGKIGHAELKIGDSTIMLSDEMPGGSCRSPQSLGGTTITLFLYVEDADRTFNQAVTAGGKVVRPVEGTVLGGSLRTGHGPLWPCLGIGYSQRRSGPGRTSKKGQEGHGRNGPGIRNRSDFRPGEDQIKILSLSIENTDSPLFLSGFR